MYSTLFKRIHITQAYNVYTNTFAQFYTSIHEFFIFFLELFHFQKNYLKLYFHTNYPLNIYYN